MTRMGILGATGRMGQRLIHEVYRNTQCELAAALIRKGNPFLGQDVGPAVGLPPMGLLLSDDTVHGAQVSDVLIDFSHPQATIAHLETKVSTPLVICVTGFDEVQKQKIKEAAQTMPLVLASNTSLGVTVLQRISREVARALGPDYDIEISEMHHAQKEDAPSGTALSLGEGLASLPGFHLNPTESRAGPREQGTIGFSVSRGGQVLGDHHVNYAGMNEVITLSHRALNRSLFAQGALKAALWVRGQKPGLYTMEDVIGL